MDRSGGLQQTATESRPSKFAVYQNPALSAALTSNSLRPSAVTFLYILSVFSASAIALLISLNGEHTGVDFGVGFLSQDVACLFYKVTATTACMILLGSFFAFMKAVSQWRNRNGLDVVVSSPSKGTKEMKRLTNRQLGLLGLRSKLEVDSQESSKKPPKSKTNSPSLSNPLVPLHESVTGSNLLSRKSGGKSSSGGGNKMHGFSTPSKSPPSPSMYLVPTASMLSPIPSSSLQASPASDQVVTTPWTNRRRTFHKGIATEEDLESFLADVDEKIAETASKLGTPSSTNGFGISTTPNTITSSVSTPGTRSTPLRPVRMSPGSQKFTTPPKKGEGDLPSPMSMEESIEAFDRLGIYPHIEQWRDSLRQWFSAIVLNPLLDKIETSHLKVIEAAAKLNIQITISQVGSDTSNTPTAANVSPIDRTDDWKPAFAVDEDGLLHHLFATLVQALDASKLSTNSFQQSHQQATPLLQECIDAITEHQRLHALMKGEWGKGLLPQNSVPADYTVQRIRKLAEGTCLKNYEYLGNGEVYDKVNKKWTLERPTDSHLLLYLFCAYLEYPKWMLHGDPTSYAGAQASKNPLFLGVLPPKERFPEKYVAIISGVPSVLHPGACILAVGKQGPPVFALYWDKKPQGCLQGRTALWDSLLLLCYKIRISYDGIVRGMHLGSSALGILPVLEPEMDD
ncbi:uncharacterized protein LOC127259307 [Andrographis paniculata]|uniref:uncharacterized protein LOC127259307 n=1 Tax=Andrographis paniculata TaxID=175694 RepID=UPI0021E807B9|nr:uncharacterized protein LOC127259307 [Andrographis paniculata]